MAEEDLLAIEAALVDLERMPTDTNVFASLHKRLHGLKGTCVAVGLPHLERLVQHGQRVVFEVRETRTFDRIKADAMFAWVDGVRAALVHLAATEEEPEIPHSLLQRLADVVTASVPRPPVRRTRLVYWSRPTRALSTGDWAVLVSRSTEANRAASITGALCRAPEAYVAMLEGERLAISETFGRIVRDPRHQRVILAAVLEIETPSLTREPLALHDVTDAPDLDGLSAQDVVGWLGRAGAFGPTSTS